VPDLASATPVGAPRVGGPWGDLRLRVFSAVVLLPIGLGCLWIGGWAWAVLIGAASVGLAFEWAALCGASRWGLAAVMAIVTVLAATGFLHSALYGLVGFIVPFPRRGGWIWPCMGVWYIGLTIVALIWLRGADDAGWDDVLFLLLVVWATDIAAYLAGRLIGGPKLAPAISPGKTWSGAIGGLAGALVVGWVAAPGGFGLAVAAALSVVAQAGDLMESAIKRHFGVKDSGKLIPGHGGLLDRLDGVLTAAPAAALLALAMGRGVGFWQ
jgi:phosphatidate cytidylyltransferase